MDTLLAPFLAAHPWPAEMLAEGQPIEFIWEHQLPHRPDQVWPFVADTSRFNRAVGQGLRSVEEIKGQAVMTDSVLGFRQKWVELPWEWTINSEIKSIRVYSQGVARFCRAWIQLEPYAGGTRLRFYFGWIPTNWFWRQMLRIGFARLQKRFEALVGEITKHLSQTAGQKNKFYDTQNKTPLDSEAQLALTRLRLVLHNHEIPEPVSNRLIALIGQGDELNLQRIRARELANDWQLDHKSVIKAFLHATEESCVNLSWDIVCPHCRGVRKEAKKLQDINEEQDCDVCQITFKTSSPNTIELTFRVHPRIRKVTAGLYCAAEPAKKPHIQLQSQLAPGGRLHSKLTLAPGVYRLRTQGEQTGLIFETSTNATAHDLHFTIGGPFDQNRQTLAEQIDLKIENIAGSNKTIVLEQFSWYNDALRPADVLCMPEFRSFISEDHLQNETILNLGVQTMLFTDMVASTRFYREQGDGRAYMAVKKHFNLVFKIFEDHDGYIVKTVGDAVMAAFNSPEQAVRAAAAVQRHFESHQHDLPIRLRISIHEGPVMAVNLQTGVDYFGGTVNYAAKLQSTVGAAEIVLSGQTAKHIEAVCNELATLPGHQWRTEKFSLFAGMNDDIQILKVGAENKKASA